MVEPGFAINHGTTKKLIALLFTISACGGTSAKDSVTAHSVDVAAHAGVEPATRTPDVQSVVISGKVTDCFTAGHEYDVQAFPVKAFDPSSNGKLVSLLRSSDTVTFFSESAASRAQANAEYDQIKSLFTTAKALSVDSTSTAGSYSLTVPSMDSVLVLGFEEREDVPEYYQYHMVSGRSNVSLPFDMGGGQCGPITDTTKGR
jgi:hypothetical protein